MSNESVVHCILSVQTLYKLLYQGFVIAVLCYHHHYPSIFQANALSPYPIRSSQDPSLPLTNSVLMMAPSRNQLPHIPSKAQLTEVKTL